MGVGSIVCGGAEAHNEQVRGIGGGAKCLVLLRLCSGARVQSGRLFKSTDLFCGVVYIWAFGVLLSGYPFSSASLSRSLVPFIVFYNILLWFLVQKQPGVAEGFRAPGNLCDAS